MEEEIVTCSGWINFLCELKRIGSANVLNKEHMCEKKVEEEEEEQEWEETKSNLIRCCNSQDYGIGL